MSDSYSAMAQQLGRDAMRIAVAAWDEGYKVGMDYALGSVRDRTDDEFTHELIRAIRREENLDDEDE